MNENTLLGKALLSAQKQGEGLSALLLQTLGEDTAPRRSASQIIHPTAQCGRGWAGRCSTAKNPTCRCQCRGINHGAKLPAREPRGRLEGKRLPKQPASKTVRHGRADRLAQVLPEYLELPRPLYEWPSFEFFAELNRPSWCRLRLWKSGDVYVFIASDPGDDVDAGVSVTNACEYIATRALFMAFSHNLDALGSIPWVWVEHYPGQGRLARDSIMREHFDLVLFVGTPEKRWVRGAERYKIGQPEWHRLTESQVIALVGG